MTIIRHTSFSRRGFNSSRVPTVPVELDRAHPLARNLLAYWVFGSAGLNDLCGNVPTLVPMSAARAVATPQGMGWVQDVNNSVLVATAPAVLNITSGSMFWTGRTFGVAGTANMGYITVTPDNVGGAPYDCYTLGNTNDPGAGQLDKLGFFTGGAVNDISGLVATGAGITSLGCSFQSGVSVTGYRNGAYSDTVAAGIVSGFSGTSQVGIGGYPFYSARYPNAHISSAGIWGRILTANEFAWLHVEPFVMLRPTKRRFYLPTTGGVAAPSTVRPRISMVA